MKKLFLLLLIVPVLGIGQTTITDSNFHTAIEICLSTNPTDGMCSESEYGAMPTWDVSNVSDMSEAFYNRDVFNADISTWDVSNVYNMSKMFGSSSFNQPIGNWDVSNVQYMHWMFRDATSFNQPIGNWDVRKVTDMTSMFAWASSFNQDLSSWCFTNNDYPIRVGFSEGCPLIESYKPVWGTCPTASANDQNQLLISIYPNPTTSIVTLQGGKQYDIEVYTLQGKKVMALTGNTIDMSHLSSATYIVKALDKVDNEEVSYKVIKN